MGIWRRESTQQEAGTRVSDLVLQTENHKRDITAITATLPTYFAYLRVYLDPSRFFV